MENEESIITIGDIFRMIRKRIWPVIAVTVAFGILFFCAVQFWYNNNHQNYQMSYYISFPGLTSGATQSTYPDGTAFRAEDTISLEVLNLVKEQGEGAFDSVDVEKMLEDDGISITQTNLNTSGTATDVQVDALMKITVGTEYFKDSKQAQDFLSLVAQYPVTHAQSLVSDASYDTYLNNFRDSQVVTYEQKINYLISQHDYLLNLYDELILTKGAYFTITYVGADGKTVSGTLDSYRSRCDAVFNEDTQKTVLDELSVKGYIYNLAAYIAEAPDNLEILEQRIKNLQIQIDQYQTILDELTSSGADSALTEDIRIKIVELYQEKVSCETEAAQIEENVKLTEEENAARNKSFDDKLNRYCSLLEEQTQIFKNVQMKFFEQQSYFRLQSKKLAVTGGVSSVVAGIGGLLIGFVCAGFIVCIIDLPAYKMNKMASAVSASADVPKKQESDEDDTKQA